MNFKINLWTLLFVLALGALIYLNFLQKDSNLPGGRFPPPIVPQAPRAGLLKVDTAMKKINAFREYLKAIEITDTTTKVKSKEDLHSVNQPEFAPSKVPDVNRKVYQFRVTQSKQLDSIRHFATEDTLVYALLALGWNPEKKIGEEAMIDLVFRVRTNEDSSQYVDACGYRYYDFTNPCPPLCNDIYFDPCIIK